MICVPNSCVYSVTGPRSSARCHDRCISDSSPNRSPITSAEPVRPPAAYALYQGIPSARSSLAVIAPVGMPIASAPSPGLRVASAVNINGEDAVDCANKLPVACSNADAGSCSQSLRVGSPPTLLSSRDDSSRPNCEMRPNSEAASPIRSGSAAARNADAFVAFPVDCDASASALKKILTGSNRCTLSATASALDESASSVVALAALAAAGAAR